MFNDAGRKTNLTSTGFIQHTQATGEDFRGG
jgi:hypothetical protein